ncbi:MAG: sigma-70 family RNA polymerase sigma factor [Hamadaea sp.]|nr:sigma-70 family RNA polymerase sigma factor [Hamadaea sp.]
MRSLAVPIPDSRTPVAASADDFEVFYSKHISRLHRALTMTLGDSVLAREAVDEAMARAFARWRFVRTYDNPTGWVYRVAVNQATSWWRKRRRELPPGDIEQASVHDGPDAGAVAVRDAVSALPRPLRAVVVCRVLLEMSTADTAAALRIPEGTVKSRLARALADLRSQLIEERAA